MATWATAGGPPQRRASVTTPAQRLEEYRRDLTSYCYRMLGSRFDAEDAVQETMVRAWRGVDRFEGRSSLRSWLYRIATNVCLDARHARERHAPPVDVSASPRAVSVHGRRQPGRLQPLPDWRWSTTDRDPAQLAASRETIRLAFVAALQYLPARQRAVLILREVLGWSAREVAELLDTSVASVTSALQRARATLVQLDLGSSHADAADLGPQVYRRAASVAGYVEAFERCDIGALVSLLHDDVARTSEPTGARRRPMTTVTAPPVAPPAPF